MGPSNVFLGYAPPAARARLRDGDGKEVRNNAEKSILINEYFVDLFTLFGGLVWDMFAGSSPMGVACVKTGRYYVGSDLDGDLHTWSTQRIGKAWAAKER